MLININCNPSFKFIYTAKTILIMQYIENKLINFTAVYKQDMLNKIILFWITKIKTLAKFYF